MNGVQDGDAARSLKSLARDLPGQIVLVLEGGGKTRWFEGNFAAYEKAVAAENPDRVAHRRNKYHRLSLKR